MLKTLFNRMISDAEKKTGENADWMRDILRVSTKSFLVFGLFTPLSTHRQSLPLAMHHLARLAAVSEADCGPCFQTVVNYAVHDGVEDRVIRAAIEDDVSKLTDLEATVYRFASAIAHKAPDDDDARTVILREWGEQGLIDLAYAVAGTRVFPTVKRAMGYGAACHVLEVRGKRVAPHQSLEAA